MTLSAPSSALSPTAQKPKEKPAPIGLVLKSSAPKARSRNDGKERPVFKCRLFGLSR
jgi:hypothetical protein